MGWLYSEAWPTASAMRDHLRDSLTRSGYDIVKDALTHYGRHYYAAIRKDGKTFIFVALIERDRIGYGYKDMDESMGPNNVDCPLSILDAASPVEDLYSGDPLEWATKWRANVRAFHAAKKASRASAKSVKLGDKVWIANARGNPFTVASVGRATKKIYGVSDDPSYGGYWVKLPVSRIERVEPV